MRFSTVVAFTIAAASAVPSLGFVLTDHLRPHYVVTRDLPSSEALMARAEEEIMKRSPESFFEHLRNHPDITLTAREPSDLEARSRKFFTGISPGVIFTDSRHLKRDFDDQLEKRVAISPIDPSILRLLNQHPGFRVARDDLEARHGRGGHKKHGKKHGKHGRKGRKHGHKSQGPGKKTQHVAAGPVQ